MFERFTQAARDAVVAAQEEARDQGSPALGVTHLLVGVLRDADGAPAVVLARHGIDAAAVAELSRRVTASDDEALSALGIDVDEVRRRTEQAFGPGALDEPRPVRGRLGLTKGHLPFSTGAKSALSEAVRGAAFHRDHEIGSAQLFLGLLADDEVVLTLRQLGLDASTEDLISSVRSQLSQAA